MFVQFLVTFIMMTGLFCTVSVKLPGTIIILLGAIVYGLFTNFVTFVPWITAVLVFTSGTAELGGRVLRIYLTRNYSISRDFSINSRISYFGGILVSGALLGPIPGLIIWQLIAGKTLIPRSNTVLRVLLRLAGVASIRFACGITMIVLIHMYIFI